MTTATNTVGASLDRYRSLLGAEIDELGVLARPLHGREVLMVNSTAVGGGVAELLSRLVPLLEELGLAPRWDVIEGGRRPPVTRTSTSWSFLRRARS